MPRQKAKPGALPTKSISPQRAGILGRQLLVTEKALNHLQAKGLISKGNRAGCCKPDGGTCCPNAKSR